MPDMFYLSENGQPTFWRLSRQSNDSR